MSSPEPDTLPAEARPPRPATTLELTCGPHCGTRAVGGNEDGTSGTHTAHCSVCHTGDMNHVVNAEQIRQRRCHMAGSRNGLCMQARPCPDHDPIREEGTHG